MEETVEQRRARWLSVSNSASAMPTRRVGARRERARTKTWEGEHSAYRELRRGGERPETVASAPKMLEALNG